MKHHPKSIDLLCSTSPESTISDIRALLPGVLWSSSKKKKTPPEELYAVQKMGKIVIQFPNVYRVASP